MTARSIQWVMSEAASAIDRLKLSGANLEVADYWLSLWRGEEGPRFADFDPGKVKAHLGSVAIFSGNEHAIACRLAGRNIEFATGVNLRHRDVLALTPKAFRRQRLTSIGAVARGGVLAGLRDVHSVDGGWARYEEIFLPFADFAEDGTTRFLVHNNWRPGGDDFSADAPLMDLLLTKSPRYAAFAEG